MAQPLRCDVHEDAAGILLVQNLVEGTVNVACPECLPDAVGALADAAGVTEAIWNQAQAELLAEVERNAAKAEKAAARKAGRKPTGPQDTGDAGESPAPAVPVDSAGDAIERGQAQEESFYSDAD